MHTCTPVRLATSFFILLCLLTGMRLSAQESASNVSVGQAKADMRAARTDEDFSTLSLEGSHLHSAPPLLGDRVETPEYVRELIQVQWREGDAIDLYVIRPTGIKNPPVVLYLYGFPSDTDRFHDDKFCKRVVSNGAAAVGFVSALTGQRYHSRPIKEWFVSELPGSLAATVHDVQMILNYLQTRGDLDMDHVGMFGEGSGGAIAILSAASDPRIKALDLLQPWGDWPDWLAEAPIIPEKERPAYTTPAFLKKLLPLEPVSYLPQLKSRSIRMQIVDASALKLPAKLLEIAARGDKVLHYKSAQDLLNVSSGGRLFQWIGEQVKPATETPTTTPAPQPEARRN